MEMVNTGYLVGPGRRPQRRILRCLYLLKARVSCVGAAVVVYPLQPSSSVNSGYPGPESSILVSSRWACPISSQVTDHWGEPCNRTGEVHPVDLFHSLDNLKNHLASVTFCSNSGDYNVQNGAVIELSFVVSIKRVSSSLMDGVRLLSTLLSFMLPIAVFTNEVRSAWSVCFLLFAISGNTV